MEPHLSTYKFFNFQFPYSKILQLFVSFGSSPIQNFCRECQIVHVEDACCVSGVGTRLRIAEVTFA